MSDFLIVAFCVVTGLQSMDGINKKTSFFFFSLLISLEEKGQVWQLGFLEAVGGRTSMGSISTLQNSCSLCWLCAILDLYPKPKQCQSIITVGIPYPQGILINYWPPWSLDSPTLLTNWLSIFWRKILLCFYSTTVKIVWMPVKNWNSLHFLEKKV